MSKSLSNPVLSIVTVSAYDAERLKITLTSLLMVSDLSLEHLTVVPADDSPSIQLWEQLCGQIPNFQLVHDENRGIYPAMNIGAKFARGDFIVFWNGGEEITSINDINSLLLSLGMIATNIVITQGKIEWIPNHYQNLNEYEGFMLGEPGKFISHQTFLINLNFFRQLGGFKERYKVVADTELMLRSYSKRSEVTFLECSPVFVQNSVYASSQQRLSRWEMLRINAMQVFRERKWNRIRNFLKSELKFFSKKLASRLEFSDVGRPSIGYSKQLVNRLPYPSNFGREVILNLFISQIERLEADLEIAQINVVGGSVSDPEATYLKGKFPNARLATYGIENSDFYLDLNLKSSTKIAPGDIVLVSQVLEHTWEHDRFFANIVNLTKIGGVVWIGCPASNKLHGSPDYYSSGFTSTYLQNNLKKFNTEIIDTGFFGTKRLYLATHWIPGWLSVRGHKYPLLYSFDGSPFFKGVVLWLRYLGQLIVLSFTNPRPASNERWATESWVLARRL